jgi:L-alanine-DL-glutamate epimerase-like enolase superfamily enzyme
MIGCSSAKAAVDMAIYDLVSQISGLPLYKFLGGYRDRLETDFTVSVNSPNEMGEYAVRYVKSGFCVLKKGAAYDRNKYRSHKGNQLI